MPGVLEEALGTMEQTRPVLCSAIFGGASRELIEAVERGSARFSDPAIPAFSDRFASLLAQSILLEGSLNEAEERRLRQTTLIDQCVELILRGAVRWWTDLSADK